MQYIFTVQGITSAHWDIVCNVDYDPALIKPDFHNYFYLLPEAHDDSPMMIWYNSLLDKPENKRERDAVVFQLYIMHKYDIKQSELRDNAEYQDEMEHNDMNKRIDSLRLDDD